MKIVFMGTPEFSVPVLEALAQHHDIVAVYSQPPRPAGRGKADRPSPVQARAEALGLPVRHPVSLRSETEQRAFADLGADVAVVVAFGQILPKAVLDVPRRGSINRRRKSGNAVLIGDVSRYSAAGHFRPRANKLAYTCSSKCSRNCASASLCPSAAKIASNASTVISLSRKMREPACLASTSFCMLPRMPPTAVWYSLKVASSSLSFESR